MLKNVMVLDCETTGLPPKNAKWESDYNSFPRIVQLSWILNGVEKDFIIKPDGWEIPVEMTEIHGVSTERAINEGVEFAEVMDEFIKDATDSYLLIGHNIYFDISIVKANILRTLGEVYYHTTGCESALFKGKRIDTMMKTSKFVGATVDGSNRIKFPKLEELYYKLFQESFPAHNAIEDVRAVLRCIPELVRLEVITLEQKKY